MNISKKIRIDLINGIILFDMDSFLFLVYSPANELVYKTISFVDAVNYIREVKS